MDLLLDAESALHNSGKHILRWGQHPANCLPSCHCLPHLCLYLDPCLVHHLLADPFHLLWAYRNLPFIGY
ncbi:MAG: hypothetical protein JW845_00725 [Dehalococcoidales bacterium]|nr:hypothetical protein [Dehalococcoidales bacterium]